jgi:hypothetical protein
MRGQNPSKYKDQLKWEEIVMVNFSGDIRAYRIGFVGEYWIEYADENATTEEDDDDDDDEPRSFKMSNSQATLTGASQSSPYGNNGYPATNAFKNKFTHTNKGKGMWWKANIRGGDAWIWKVKILNRRDCCGQRLSGTKVLVDGQLCGQVPNKTKNGKWYEVKCSEPLEGKEIKLMTVRSEYLSIQGI